MSSADRTVRKLHKDWLRYCRELWLYVDSECTTAGQAFVERPHDDEVRKWNIFAINQRKHLKSTLKRFRGELRAHMELEPQAYKKRLSEILQYINDYYNPSQINYWSVTNDVSEYPDLDLDLYTHNAASSLTTHNNIPTVNPRPFRSLDATNNRTQLTTYSEEPLHDESAELLYPANELVLTESNSTCDAPSTPLTVAAVRRHSEPGHYRQLLNKLNTAIAHDAQLEMGTDHPCLEAKLSDPDLIVALAWDSDTDDESLALSLEAEQMLESEERKAQYVAGKKILCQLSEPTVDKLKTVVSSSKEKPAATSMATNRGYIKEADHLDDNKNEAGAIVNTTMFPTKWSNLKVDHIYKEFVPSSRGFSDYCAACHTLGHPMKACHSQNSLFARAWAIVKDDKTK